MHEPNLGPTAQTILAFFLDHRRITYTADDICEVLDCPSTQVQTALETLNNEGFVEREESCRGPDTYFAL